MSDFNTTIINEFHENDGVTEMFGDRLVLLTTTGAKSGKKRVTPIVHRMSGDRMLVFASKAGADTHPAWYINLMADAHASVEVREGGKIVSYDVVAEDLKGEDRDAEFAAQVAEVPTFGEYQEKTDRIIPVVELKRV
jgi:deazaflavin-dependent oxidoreductase (nitroreductase family)